MSAGTRRLLESLLTFLLAIIPKSPIAIVYGTPITEGNAVEMASALSRRYRGRIYWLVDSGPKLWKMVDTGTPVVFLRKGTVKALVLYLRSEAVFFTHGLYGAARPSRRQTFVNLWHGDGIKRKPTTEASRRSLLPATYVSGGTRLLTARKAHDFKMPASSTLVYGNPRVLQFRDAVPPALLREIGAADRPYVIWLPTFRKSSITGVGYEDKRVHDLMSKIVSATQGAGYDIIVKAHRQDAESRGVAGTIPVSDLQLLQHNASLYSLIGGSVALITDYSSVWTDYLLLDRPIGFLVPDADIYMRTPGLYPQDILDWLPGPKLMTDSDIGLFIDVITGTAKTNDRKYEAKRRLGLVEYESPADEILNYLKSHGCLSRGQITDNRTFDVDSRPRLVNVKG